MGNLELFEQMADRYDTEDRATVARAIAEAIRGRIRDAGEKTALDYGCGTGLVGLELVDVFRSILLMDAAEQMVHVVERKIEVGGWQNASALCLDLLAENAPDLRADVVILAQVLLHIQEVPALLSRLFSLVNEGGHLLIVDFDTNKDVVSDKVHSGFDQAALIDACRSAGFTGADAATFYHGKNLFMGKDASLFLLDAVR